MSQIIDADGHIVEPRSFWQEYVEPAFRDRVPQIVKDDEGTDRANYNGELVERRAIPQSALCIHGSVRERHRARQLLRILSR